MALEMTRVLPRLVAPLAVSAALTLGACAGTTGSVPRTDLLSTEDRASLETIVAARDEDQRARDVWRNPVETLAFFGVESDDTVVEGLPGGGWYTRIVLPYVAQDGRYMAVNYDPEMFRVIFPNMAEERLARFQQWPSTFPDRAREFTGLDVEVTAFQYGKAPEELAGTVDAVLMIRSLHNLARVGGEYLDSALAETFRLLKPGGVLGVVQHRAPADAQGDAASGAHGYLREADVVAFIEAAGFELEARSEINANPKDQPAAEDIVWRLPPSARGDESRRAEFDAIGESDRMTLRFRKPE